MFEGTFHTGDWISGLLTQANGDTYTGEFKGEVFHGQGTLVSKEGSFTGTFDEGKRSKGKMEFKDGNVYEGEFQNDKVRGGIFSVELL